MLCLEDCLDFCELDPDEIEAIAEHEHIPLIIAAELGSTLLKSPGGVKQLHTFILEDMEIALEHGQLERAGRLALVYRHFEQKHPVSSSL